MRLVPKIIHLKAYLDNASDFPITLLVKTHQNDKFARA